MLQQRGGGIRKFACVPNHHCKMWNITTCIRYCLLVATHTTTYSLNLRGLLDLSVNDPGGPSTRGGALKVMKACAGIMQARVTKKKQKKEVTTYKSLNDWCKLVHGPIPTSDIVPYFKRLMIQIFVYSSAACGFRNREEPNIGQTCTLGGDFRASHVILILLFSYTVVLLEAATPFIPLTYLLRPITTHATFRFTILP